MTERSRLVGMASSGSWVGNIIALPLGSFLCVSGFDGGWASIFYIFGILFFVLI
jgi:MFS family permease